MNKLLLGAAVALTALASPAAAQQGVARSNAQPMTRAAVQARVQTQFAMIDGNRDGFISQPEARAFAGHRQAQRAERQDRRGERQAKRAERRGEKQGQGRGNLFARLDTNNDGVITQAEAQAVQSRRQAQSQGQVRGQRGAGLFARLDANRDGNITRAEFDARAAVRGDRRGDRAVRMANRGQRGAFGPQMFARVDSDRDGRISLAEVTAQRLARFDRLDANRDGTLTREERRAARAARQGRRNG